MSRTSHKIPTVGRRERDGVRKVDSGLGDNNRTFRSLRKNSNHSSKAKLPRQIQATVDKGNQDRETSGQSKKNLMQAMN